MYLIGFLIVGVVVGSIASLIRKAGRSDTIGFIITGLLGSLMGGALFGAVRHFQQGNSGSQVAAFLGAVILVAFLETMKKM